ncbi:hypothetical protein [Winogradskyella aquimaris]|uniref:Uncharacterized protein n=1 Tax=Winogradskyella aquimaris TaxID=864074 RepID=A0ABU5EJW0_9FLAO|nr:hypothetical protein [Winogradskyella aquimaris]MDY2586543.1 hypothetical protein [Winogradskyella aquimaris]
MSRLETNATFEKTTDSEVKRESQKTKISIAITFLVLTALLTYSYMNGHIFMEHLAVCGFIISCIAIIKLMETK